MKSHYKIAQVTCSTENQKRVLWIIIKNLESNKAIRLVLAIPTTHHFGAHLD